MSKIMEEINFASFDFIEILCSNAKQSAYFYCSTLGFQPHAYSGLETGRKDGTSYALKQGDIYLVISSSFNEDDYITDFVKKHGDGVYSIGLRTDDVENTYKTALKKGAKKCMEIIELKDQFGTIKIAGIHAFGDVVHKIIERSNYRGFFMPGFIEWKNSSFEFNNLGLYSVDHATVNVEIGEMVKMKKFYEDVLDFHELMHFDESEIHTDLSALRSSVMSNKEYTIKIPINEATTGSCIKSQIAEFVEFNNGPGCQHLAFLTTDILKSVSIARGQGCEFLDIDPSYYENLARQNNLPPELDIDDLKKKGILFDCDENGYMLQIFTKPLSDRPTFFIEIIQRNGAQAFGKNNFQALFRSVEIEQIMRGSV